MTVTDSEKLTLVSVIDRIPDLIDEDGADDSTDLSTAVLILCQDFLITFCYHHIIYIFESTRKSQFYTYNSEYRTE